MRKGGGEEGGKLGARKKRKREISGKDNPVEKENLEGKKRKQKTVEINEKEENDDKMERS